MATKSIGKEGFPHWVGAVEDVNDPLELGRVRVRIFGKHASSQISTEDLQWTTPLMSVFSAALKGVGQSPVGVVVGTQMWGFWLDGHEGQIPICWGPYCKMTDGNNDVPGLARGQNTVQDSLVGPEPPSSYAAKYPMNWAWVTRAGHVIEYDDTPGAERMRHYHKSGSYTEISSTGRTVTKSVDNHIVVDAKDSSIYVGGNCTVEVKGTVTGSAQAWYITGDVHVTGNITATGDITDHTRSMQGDRDIYNVHDHGGVQSGGNNTTPPLQKE